MSSAVQKSLYIVKGRLKRKKKKEKRRKKRTECAKSNFTRHPQLSATFFSFLLSLFSFKISHRTLP